MATRVIVPPAPLLLPSDIPGGHAGNDARVALIIAAAQAEIDGPLGWLGRALGPQTLETTLDHFEWGSVRLPCPPIVDVLSVGYRDRAGVMQTVDAALWECRDDRLVRLAKHSWPKAEHCADAVRITYLAGYDDNPVIDGGTGPLPAEVKMALQLSVLHTLAMGAENLFLRSEEVEGVGTTTYTISTAASELIKGATDRYLSGLRIYA